ncbi:alpha/beta fold hydrolase [Longispora albida]|uniref:alpha/beta fold hydrolase n=1 Tax=Longispora albida TaxID=203523 RepID=UPI000685330D|nr:alpha/beta fold hydrolase [Longispora albida]
MMTTELTVPGSGLPAVIREPSGPALGGVVTLHPASNPGRDQPIFRHLAETLVPAGYAVLSYDRRQHAAGDVPFGVQAADARAAHEVLRARLGGAPCGFWAYSQGSWPAVIAAAEDPGIAFLALVGGPGVSPAEQMRYSTAEALRRRGFGAADIAEALTARLAMERLLRGTLGRAEAEIVLGGYKEKEWFPHCHLPAEIPPGPLSWPDMDFDLEPFLRRAGQPVLLIYGEDEECVPVAASIDTWHRTGNPALEIAVLPGLGHFPGDRATGTLSPEYTKVLATWFGSLSPGR